MKELEIIKKYFSKLAKKSKSSLNLNDDVFFNKLYKLVVSLDTYVEGKHFINFQKPDLVIKKIIRSSISDLLCKGVKPKYYFLSASGNSKSFSMKNLTKISKSLKEEQKKYNITIGGGDTVYSNKLNFTITSICFSLVHAKIIFFISFFSSLTIFLSTNLCFCSAIFLTKISPDLSLSIVRVSVTVKRAIFTCIKY